MLFQEIYSFVMKFFQQMIRINFFLVKINLAFGSLDTLKYKHRLKMLELFSWLAFYVAAHLMISSYLYVLPHSLS